eukprot:412441-Pyramimonas_sp.AAC.1
MLRSRRVSVASQFPRWLREMKSFMSDGTARASALACRRVDTRSISSDAHWHCVCTMVSSGSCRSRDPTNSASF